MPVEIRNLPALEAIAYFRRKGFTFGFAWQDVWQEEHVRAFTVAKAMSRDILEDIRAAVDKALAEGTTLEQFQKDLRPLLERKGWWGKKAMQDPLTGETKEVQLGSPRRLRTIFDVNMRMAYQAGRWERMQRSKSAFPYVRYVTAEDRKVRPQHATWHGTIRPIDDGWWDTHYPPCGWRCRCSAIPINDRMMARRGWEVTEKPASFLPQTYRNPRTGEESRYEAGIDPGFGYNVGKAYLQDLAARPLSAGAEGQDIASAADELGGAIAGFLEILGVEADEAERGRVFIDKAGWPIAVSNAWFRAPGGGDALPGGARPAQLELAARAIAEPAEIRLRWVKGEDGRPMLFRRYFAAIAVADLDLVVDVVVDVGRGWRFVTSADAGFDLEQLRAGTIAYSQE